MAASERIARDAWGDTEIYLHVEDDKIPANALYEATGYEDLGYEYDPEFPYSKDEADLLRTVTYRRKKLGEARPVALPEKESNVDKFTTDMDDEEASDDDELDEEDEEEQRQDDIEEDLGFEDDEEDEDYSWVVQLRK